MGDRDVAVDVDTAEQPPPRTAAELVRRQQPLVDRPPAEEGLVAEQLGGLSG
jgi:hypothetical protein